MHHIVLERWSRGSSAVHRVDPRAKVFSLLVFLVALATAHTELGLLAVAFSALLCCVLLLARLPFMPALARAAVVLPFTGVFALITWISGDPARAAGLVIKSYLSALAVLTVVATTPLPSLLRGLELLRVPLFLITVTQFLYRYLFVISEEAQHMGKAAAARGARARSLGFSNTRFKAAAGALAVLFVRSYERAQDVHHAMLARGFEGRLHPLVPLRFRSADTVFAAVASGAVVIARVAVEKFS